MKPRMSQRIQFSLAYLLVAIIVLSFLQSWLLSPRTIEIPMSKFLELLKADQIEKVAVTEREIRGVAKPGALPAPPSAPGDRLRKLLGSEDEPRVFVTTRIPLVDDQQLVNELRAHHVEFAGRIETTFWKDLLFGWVIPLACATSSSRPRTRRPASSSSTSWTPSASRARAPPASSAATTSASRR